MQLEFELEEKSDLDRRLDEMESRIESVKLSSDKVRKKLFAENGYLSKGYMDSLARIDELEREVARLKRTTGDRCVEEWLYKTDGMLFSRAS